MSPNKLVYLAGPIDQVTREDALLWRTDATSRLSYRGWNVYNPAAAFRCLKPSSTMAQAIDNVNREALRESNVVIAKIASGETAFGTIREIEYAVMAGKPVWLIAPHLKQSLATYDLYLCDSMDDLFRRFDQPEQSSTDRLIEMIEELPKPRSKPVIEFIPMDVNPIPTSTSYGGGTGYTAFPEPRPFSEAQEIQHYYIDRHRDFKEFIRMNYPNKPGILSWFDGYHLSRPEPVAGEPAPPV